MKKFLAYVCAAALFFGAFLIPQTGTYAMTKVSSADEAVEKSMDALLKMLDEAEIDGSFTKDDLENMLFGACGYTVDGFVGPAFWVEKFKIVSPSAGNSGFMSADVSIFLDDAEEALTVKKELSKSGGMSTDDGNGENETSPVSEGSSAEDTAAAKKRISAAKQAISAAIWDFEVSNATTAADILKMANDAVGDSKVTVTLDSANFKLIKASTTVEGTVSATLTLSCGGVTDAVPVGKTVPVEVTAESTAIDEDRHLVGVAVDAMRFTNRTTKEEMLDTAKKAVKNGTQVEWKTFDKKNATFREKGEIIGYLTMTLGGETRETRFSEAIPMLVRNMPTDEISVNKEEWEVLRIVNVERQKQGLFLMTMHPVLQDACDTRAVEIAEKFSHTRPNGNKPFTAISSDFKYANAGENIYQCNAPSMAVSGERAMNSWMNSDGHRANILTATYDYIGVGTYDNETLGTAVQLFAGVNYPLVSAVTASGKTDYIDEDEMQKDYLICMDSKGVKTYIPLDIDYLTKTDGGYTLKLRITEPVVLTVGGSASGDSSKTNEGKTDDPKNGLDSDLVAPFTDVRTTDYYANAVKWAVEKAITLGTSDTTFSPDMTCTRAQILTFLWRAVGSPKAETENPFTDVARDDYYYDAAIWAHQMGMVEGSAFEGDTPCTRASTVVYLWKNANMPAGGASVFEDVPADADFANAVSWAVDAGVTVGTGETTFSPDMICSRGQIVTFLNRAVNQ